MKANRKPFENRALLVIDETPLRKIAIRSVQKWFKKIEDVEKSALKFSQTDLKLYTDWFNLSIQPLQKEIELIRRDFLKLAEFHNLMVSISLSKKIPMPSAYLFLMEEDEQYQNGDEHVRTMIDARRKKRALDLENELYGSSHDDRTYSDEDSSYSEQESLRDLYEQAQADEERIRENRESNLEYIERYELLSDNDLREYMKDFDTACGFVLDACSVLLPAARVDLLRRIWQFTPVRARTYVNKKIKKSFGAALDDLIDAIDEQVEIRSRLFYEESENDWDFKETYTPSRTPSELKEDDQLRMKSIFRKIVRRIHPDHLKVEEVGHLKQWFALIWRKVAEAHEKNDLSKLTSLHHKIMVALKEFDQLALSELKEAGQSLETEYRSLCEEVSDLKESPAWNFSKLKNYEKLQAKESKPYLMQIQQLNREVAEMQKQRQEIERIAELMKTGEFRFHDRAQRVRRRPSRRRNRRLDR
jgi:hypothetical protein